MRWKLLLLHQLAAAAIHRCWECLSRSSDFLASAIPLIVLRFVLLFDHLARRGESSKMCVGVCLLIWLNMNFQLKDQPRESPECVKCMFSLCRVGFRCSAYANYKRPRTKWGEENWILQSVINSRKIIKRHEWELHRWDSDSPHWKREGSSHFLFLFSPCGAQILGSCIIWSDLPVCRLLQSLHYNHLSNIYKTVFR